MGGLNLESMRRVIADLAALDARRQPVDVAIARGEAAWDRIVEETRTITDKNERAYQIQLRIRKAMREDVA